ncbi:MAG: sensor histidine kinase [Chitinophagales bacterium]|nr:sensor histidine kinase [Chitinophagales bacterium]
MTGFKKIFTVIFVLLSVLLFGQFDRNKTYTYQELNNILELARSNNDNETLAEVYLKLGDYEGDYFAEYDKSLKYYNYAINHFKATKDSDGILRANHAIARRYRDAGLYTEALQILLNLEKTYSEDEKTHALTLVWFDLNLTYRQIGEYQMAMKYLNKAAQANHILKDTLLELRILFSKIEAFESTFERDSAIMLAFEAFDISKKIENNEMAAQSLFYIGYINKMKGEYVKAEKYIGKSLEILPFQAYSERRKRIYKELSEVYNATGRAEMGYAFLLNYTMLSDSIANKNRLESFNNLALKYGSKEKQTSIELLKIEKEYEISKNLMQRRSLYILGFGLLIVLLSVYFIVKFYNQQISTAKIINDQKQEINQQQIRELEDTIRINSMRSMIEGQEIERERIAKDLHDSLGGLLSAVKLQFDYLGSINKGMSSDKSYSQAHHLLDTAVSEVRTISRNLQPSSLQDLGLVPAIRDLINRFKGDNYPDIDFQYYEMPDKMDRMIALTVYRIIQELLNNSLKHAQANEILIQLNAEDDELVIQYEDDGVGFDMNNLQQKGMGLENIKTRVNFVHGVMHTESEPGNGMSVIIRVKYAQS